MTPEERAYAAADLDAETAPEVTRRLSWLRIVGLVAVIVAATAGVVGFRSATHNAAPAAVRSSFMPYVDVTATPQYAFEDSTKSASASLVLGFVVSSKAQACDPSWGGAYSAAQAASSMDLDRRIARLRQRGGHVAISFGGAANAELAIGCTDPTALLDAYRSIVRRYSVDTIDLDIEGAAASSPSVTVRRAQAIRALQQQEKRAGRTLQVWLTMPVDPSGLTATGREILTAMLAAKVTVTGVNGMTMDYGRSLAVGQSLASATESALSHLARQLAAAYTAAGVPMSTSAAWQRVGATPMIGQNDVAAERFGLADAGQLLAYAQRHHVSRLSMWSVNRDQTCGPNYANVTIVSVNCSGIDQHVGAFSLIFARFTAHTAAASPSGNSATTPAPNASTSSSTTIVDNPATSPYPIWDVQFAYTDGTKIVWHHNVYEAKWWTQGDTPDAPVAATTDTPWTLVGPVLPGEHPLPTPTVKAGSYPTWSATDIYTAGRRVIYRGGGYQAKWYTQGDVPGQVVSDAGQTPWELVTTG